MTSETKQSSAQKIEELKRKLQQDKEIMKGSSKKKGVDEMMSGVIKTIATFEGK